MKANHSPHQPIGIFDSGIGGLTVAHALVKHFLKEKYNGKRIGLIGTRQTVNSHIYKKKIDDLNLNIALSSSATNLLASAIEEFGNHPVIDSLLQVYLAHPDLEHIDALVLACT